MKYKRILALAMVVLGITSTNFTNVLAGSGDVFSVGANMKGYDGKDIDTRNDATTFANNIARAGYSKILIKTPYVSDFSKSNLNSSVVFLAGHGTTGSVNFPYLDDLSDGVILDFSEIDRGNKIGIFNKSFNRTDLAVVAACYAGTPGGFTETIYDNGATTAMGWTKKVEDSTLEEYCEVLSNYLGDGYSLREALIETRNDLLNGKGPSGSKIKLESTVFDYKVYGNTGTTLSEENEKYILDTSDYNDIQDYIQNNIDENFNINDFISFEREVEGAEEYSAITFRYKIGEFESDFGYNVFLHNNKVTEIVKVGNELYDEPMPMTISDITENDVKEMVLQQSLNEDVVDQEVEYLYNSEKKQAYYKVVTEYGNDDIGYYCTTFTYNL